MRVALWSSVVAVVLGAVAPISQQDKKPPTVAAKSGLDPCDCDKKPPTVAAKSGLDPCDCDKKPPTIAATVESVSTSEQKAATAPISKKDPDCTCDKKPTVTPKSGLDPCDCDKKPPTVAAFLASGNK